MLPIFLVEDDDAIKAQLVGAMDAVCDAQVIATVTNQKDASLWLEAHHGEWGLAVLDLFLDQGTGFGILEEMTDRNERDRVIVLTNSATAENRARCLALGAHAVFDKTTELDIFLEHCLRHPRQRFIPTV